MSQIPSIIVVTGNENKLREILAIAPKNVQLTPQSISLMEIQTLDLHAIVTHKLEEAYALVHKPLIVDDISAELSGLGGLPGPFIKFFIDKLGPGVLYDLSKISKNDDDNVTIRCLAGYYDGTTMLFGEGIVQGHVAAPRGENGFGFDSTFVPSGETRTMAELYPEEKNELSQRAEALHNLFAELKTHFEDDGQA
jgi:non-canonical purine NTP pyrophosphatase (RdgB/HAM1 family)